MFLELLQVKYGDSLRRFTAPVNENDQLDLDMDGLRAKILSLFSFSPDAELTLTYIDEDGDVVSLVDDDDLRDAMKQQLKFLRIDVLLNNDNGGKSYTRSSASSTPLRSPRGQHPLLNINSGSAEVLKTLPEPLRESLIKLSLDMASKATSTCSPIFSELADCLSKMGLSYLNSDLRSLHGGDTQIRNSEIPLGQSVPAAAGSNASKHDVRAGVLGKFTSLESSSNVNQDVGVQNVAGVVGATVTPFTAPVGLNIPVGSNIPFPEHENSTPVDSSFCVGDKRKEAKQVKDNALGKSVGCGFSPSFHRPQIYSSVSSQTTDVCKDPFTECPFLGMPILNDVAPPTSTGPRIHPFKRNHTDSTGGIFHRGVRCDGCGVHPITGPRFKSKV